MGEGGGGLTGWVGGLSNVDGKGLGEKKENVEAEEGDCEEL